MLFVIAITLTALIGYLAQTTGLCMVRGVNETIKGNPEFLIAILLSGVLSWIAFITADIYNVQLELPVYSASWWFVLGGIVFGLGTALNQGCGVSTLGKLARGDLNMLLTITGWLIGWSILSFWQPETVHVEIFHNKIFVLGILILLTISIVTWALLGDKKRKTLWFSMLGIGLLAGFLFLYERHWTPSGLLRDVSNALIHKQQVWPSFERYLTFIALIFGMIFAAWRTKKFKLININYKSFLVHTVAGTLMGIGAALALGGNDSQLLISLPIFSPAGATSVLFMLIGIRIGLFLNQFVIEY
ncbi:YeeE/YedE thiosulfate transporter family protein [Thalassotalea crassostreae]|uniref:YeeE/YedE thiosulfate transporter family protein n=1 Tax=Thalassotalea crassostreae TaxID=1763536 RepID=UPI0008398D4D|nr:YeeE/YedE thiosulfate transporter family protein [Thalassotalea crassostreae]